MRHPTEGVLRRLVDEPAGVADADRAHVAGCGTCLAGLEAARADARSIATALGSLLLGTQPQLISRINVEGITINVATVVSYLAGRIVREVFSIRESVSRHASRVGRLPILVHEYLRPRLVEPYLRAIPCLPGLILNDRRIALTRLTVIGIIGLQVPVLGEVQRHA